MMRLAPEGYPFIAVFFVLTIVAVFALGPKWSAPTLVLLLFMLYFFRDPERATPSDPGFISPADGRIILVKPVREDRHLKADALMISIFMSPFDVHVNRAPCRGTVREVLHTPGRFRAAYREDAWRVNENTAMVLECSDDAGVGAGTPILVRQVAGFLARRTVCRVGPGDTLERGERFGMIKFSSRIDVYLPPSVEVLVRPGDRVLSGRSILAAPRTPGAPGKSGGAS